MSHNVNSEPPAGFAEIMDRVVKVSSRAQLENVYIEESHAKRAEVDRSSEGMQLDLSHKPPQVIFTDSPNHFLIRVPFVVTSKTEQDSEPALQIEATFILRYSLTDATDLSSRDFAAFGRINGVHNAWPYWREFVQSTTVRMGLSALTAPLFRVESALAAFRKASEEQTAVGSEGKQGVEPEDD